MRVLVVYKRSFLESHKGDRVLWRRLSPADRKRFRHADRENRATLDHVMEVLRGEGAQATAVYRGLLSASPRFDLIVAVGGDGTFFMAAHRAHGTPIIGINSHPGGSLGLFAAADRASFRPKLIAALQGRLKPVRLNRMTLEINGRPHPDMALNDILIAHRIPASLSRLAVSVDGGAEEIQRSSGIWISTAAGSTAAIRAAGGHRMPIASKRLQFLAREPYDWPSRVRRRRGYAKVRMDLRILMSEASLWIDGVRTRVDLHLGDRVRLLTGGEPAVVLGFDARRRDRLFP